MVKNVHKVNGKYKVKILAMKEKEECGCRASFLQSPQEKSTFVKAHKTKAKRF